MTDHWIFQEHVLNAALYDWFLENHPELRAAVVTKYVPRKNSLEMHVYSKPLHINVIGVDGRQNITVRLDFELSLDVFNGMTEVNDVAEAAGPMAFDVIKADLTKMLNCTDETPFGEIIVRAEIRRG